MLKNLSNRLVQLNPMLSGPRVLNVFTTNRCNFSCAYCSRNVPTTAAGAENRYGEAGEFGPSDLTALLEKYSSIEEVSFVGIGEPFLLPHLCEMGRAARSRGTRTIVITNGTLLHNHAKLEEAFDTISISLHGLSADELKRVAGVEEKVFDRLIQNIRFVTSDPALVRAQTTITSSVVISRALYRRSEAAAAFAAEHGLKRLELHNYLPYGLDDSAECIFDDDHEIISHLSEIRSRYAERLEVVLPTFIKRDAAALSWNCISFFRVLRVDGLGNVSGCNCIMVPKKENGDWRAEDDVWRNSYFSEMRRHFKEREGIPLCCRYCGNAQ